MAVRELYFLCTRTTMHGISGIVSADAVMPALAFFSFPLGKSTREHMIGLEIYIIMYSSPLKDDFLFRYRQSVMGCVALDGPLM